MPYKEDSLEEIFGREESQQKSRRTNAYERVSTPQTPQDSGSSLGWSPQYQTTPETPYQRNTQTEYYEHTPSREDVESPPKGLLENIVDTPIDIIIQRGEDLLEKVNRQLQPKKLVFPPPDDEEDDPSLEEVF